MMAEERLQKIIARSGLCSRRDADRAVSEGRVTVDGRVAEPGMKVDPTRVHIKVDGRMLKAPEPLRYILLYKPRQVMTTCDDPEERKTVLDIIRPAIRERLYPVGRLDYHSEGLLLLTNDGDLAARVSHPRHGVVREYMVKIRGDLTDAEHRKLLAGTVVEGRHVKPRRAERVSANRGGKTTWWKVEVTEGRTHEVRELFFMAGHHVQRLRRSAIGDLRDESLKPGEFRTVTDFEVRALLRCATKAGKPSSSRRRKPRSAAGKKGPRSRSGRPGQKR
jgi:23S rRNA pseudouridine2605 synthase